MSRGKAFFWSCFAGLILGIPLLSVLSNWTEGPDGVKHRSEDVPQKYLHAAKPTVADTARDPADTDSTNRKLSNCLLPKAKYGQYSSFDGGKSVFSLIEQCPNEYVAWEEECEATGIAHDECAGRGLILAQIAIKNFSK